MCLSKKQAVSSVQGSQVKAAASGLARSYVKDVPLSPLEWGKEGQKIWKEMQEAGWRRCEFKFLAGKRRGLPYSRFVQPPSKKEHSKQLPPLGKSINGGFGGAMQLYAKKSARANVMVQAVLKERAAMLKLQKMKAVEKGQEREKCVQAYRSKYGQLEGASALLTRHRGWQEDNAAFISPDGERFLKSKCTLNKDV